MKLTSKQEAALVALSEMYDAYGLLWFDASEVTRWQMEEAKRLRDEDRFEELRKGSNSGLGITLGALHRKGLVERQWRESMAHWTYSISGCGRAALAEVESA